jgi:divalent metal cation (Fe/Co/Zn/Cd) transporter
MSAHPHDHGHSHDDDHGHSHGLVHASIKRSNAGVRAVSMSLVVLLVTALAQVAVFVSTSSVALLADLIHNFGDALTAVPLGVAFLLRSFKAEKRAGYFVVATIFISACVAAVEAVNRLIHPQQIDHLGVLALAGVIGFVGNEVAARIRLRAGRSLDSPALIADGNHARTDGFVSLAVVASAIVVALGLDIGDPLIGLTITIVILRITWQSFHTVRNDPGEPRSPDPTLGAARAMISDSRSASAESPDADRTAQTGSWRVGAVDVAVVVRPVHDPRHRWPRRIDGGAT